jgi:hypothetical protein
MKGGYLWETVHSGDSLSPENEVRMLYKGKNFVPYIGHIIKACIMHLYYIKRWTNIRSKAKDRDHAENAAICEVYILYDHNT